MITSRARGAPAIRCRLFLPQFTFAMFALVQAVVVQNAAAQNIVRIEEDWELVIREPEPNTEAPQVTCVISPVGHIDGLYSVFDLNLRHNPDYAAGGIQIQLWSGTDTLSSSSSNRGVLLQTPGETITWTQVMKLQDGDLSFQVISGSSQTWGSFGGGPKLLVSHASGLESLSGYDSAVSVANSGIGYSGHRVSSLILKKVRVYAESGESVEDAVPKVVHQHE